MESPVFPEMGTVGPFSSAATENLSCTPAKLNLRRGFSSRSISESISRSGTRNSPSSVIATARMAPGKSPMPSFSRSLNSLTAGIWAALAISLRSIPSGRRSSKICPRTGLLAELQYDSNDSNQL